MKEKKAREAHAFHKAGGVKLADSGESAGEEEDQDDEDGDVSDDGASEQSEHDEPEEGVDEYGNPLSGSGACDGNTTIDLTCVQRSASASSIATVMRTMSQRRKKSRHQSSTRPS